MKLHRSLCCQLTDPCLVIITRVIISRIKLILELYRHGHLLRLVSIMIDEKVWLLIRLREIEKTRVFFKFDAKIGNWLGLATNIPIFLIFWSKSTLLKFFNIRYNFSRLIITVLKSTDSIRNLSIWLLNIFLNFKNIVFILRTEKKMEYVKLIENSVRFLKNRISIN